MPTARSPWFRAVGGRRRPNAALALLAGIVLLLAACAQVDEEVIAAEPYECPPEECDPPEPVEPGGELVVEAGEFFFEIVEATVAEGTIEITLTNVGEAPHDFVIDEAVGEHSQVPPEGTIGQGETAEGELELFAGEYVFYCSVPGHRAAGMEGVIEVPPEPEELPGVDPELDEDVEDDEAIIPEDETGAPEDEEAVTDEEDDEDDGDDDA
jgi:plastocyanin